MLQDLRQTDTTVRSVTPRLRLAPPRIPSHDLDIEPARAAAGRVLDHVAGRVDEVLAAFLEDRCAGLAQMDQALIPVADSVRRLVTSGGKRLRPAFVWWGQQAAGGDADPEVL